MSVLRMDPPDEYAVSGRRKQTEDPLSPQIQSWANGIEHRNVKRHNVIPEKKLPLPAVSAEGIRWDVLAVTLTLIVAAFLIVLISDVSALSAGNDRIGRLSAGIASLESSNSILREEISWARTDLSANQKEGDPVRTVILSPAPGH